MLVNRLYIVLIIRITLIVLSSLAFAFSFFIFKDILININLLVLLILQIVLLIRKINLVNYELSDFFSSIEFDDTSLIIDDKYKWKSHARLCNAIGRINEKIKEIKRHDAATEVYFQNMVEHIDVGILSLDNNSRIDICNTAFKRILGLEGEVTSSIMKNEFPLLHDLIINIPAGEKELFSLNREGNNLNLFIDATSFPLLGKKMKLISVQNIKAELDDRELSTWQKMIRVLTHEIMNSISPVSSTIKTIKEFLTTEDNKTALRPEDLTADLVADSVRGLEIIDERSAGLKGFVQKFRSLTLLPEPEPEHINVSTVLGEIQHLMKGVLEEKNIGFIVHPVEREIQFNADRKLLHHVLINLINNAVDALEDAKNPQITIYTLKKENNVIIKIIDNGEGIHPDKIDDIFTPFFTTREKGSGIGLSVCKQIMRMHGGDISVKSTQGQGSTFVLQFVSRIEYS